VPEKSSATADEFETILSRLRAEVASLGAEGDGEGGEAYGLRRKEAERLWSVSAERPFLHRTGSWGRPRGLLLRPLKTVLRKLMRWYVEPLAADQARFNGTVLKLLDGLSERVDAELARLEPRVQEHTRLAGELEERLTRLERRERVSVQPAAVPPAATTLQARLRLPDYFAFESRMRGSVELIRDRQRAYVPEFEDAAPVLDLGCGRGEFLGLLRDAGIEAYGVDFDSDMVAYARGEGLEVEYADAVEHLKGLDDGSLGGIFAAQFVEHLPARALVRLLELAAAKLRPGGLLVAETINPLSPLALRNYFADLTHSQPLVPETLGLLVRQAGFTSVETRFLNEPERRLTEPADPTVAENVRRLNELLFAPLDYAILART
jgi:O-antigen chain-terminating methyltransferase